MRFRETHCHSYLLYIPLLPIASWCGIGDHVTWHSTSSESDISNSSMDEDDSFELGAYTLSSSLEPEELKDHRQLCSEAFTSDMSYCCVAHEAGTVDNWCKNGSLARYRSAGVFSRAWVKVCGPGHTAHSSVGSILSWTGLYTVAVAMGRWLLLVVSDALAYVHSDTNSSAMWISLSSYDACVQNYVERKYLPHEISSIKPQASESSRSSPLLHKMDHFHILDQTWEIARNSFHLQLSLGLICIYNLSAGMKTSLIGMLNKKSISTSSSSLTSDNPTANKIALLWESVQQQTNVVIYMPQIVNLTATGMWFICSAIGIKSILYKDHTFYIVVLLCALQLLKDEILSNLNETNRLDSITHDCTKVQLLTGESAVSPMISKLATSSISVTVFVISIPQSLNRLYDYA